MKNDPQLRHDVQAQLEHEFQLGEDSIGVEVHHGVVKLAGKVGDYAILQRVRYAVQRVEGVTVVVLDISVGNRTAGRSGLVNAHLKGDCIKRQARMVVDTVDGYRSYGALVRHIRGKT